MVMSNAEQFAPEWLARRAEFTTSDGTTLAWWRSGSADPDITYVFSHGWTLDHRAWDDVVGRLTELEPYAAFVTYDHRGHGVSDRLVPGTGNLERLADDLAGLIETAVDGPVVLAGHSMGGMTLATLAERHPDLVAERVAAAAFVATSGGPFFPRLRRNPWFLEQVIPSYFEFAERSAGKPVSDRAAQLNARMVLFGRAPRRADIDRSIEQTKLAGPGVTVEFGLSMSRHMRLSALRPYADKPVAVIGGARDRLCPPRHSVALAGALPRASLTMLADAGHFLPYERSAEIAGRLCSIRRASAFGPAGGGR
ncbi:alpha/beta hydrolase family protein [Nocardia nova SH22a]|uniref:Alpha/beta hydrolase family protein n=1 Tax=Nocardia nova SH22a TaxID=1415166 RepID=W5TMK9_9NOCA|nr:alpha/beta hydrolase [Nocardia nova]AHH18466.1 alpha/beta hydrolase family protein [Nocardia nova SH22a]